ncbi:hypothetical protein [Limnoglobus roseus]|uniref:Uncharacterized protein n=1 Tax=Limnoglobus roseus TaxID=2598579 RepID=A0A5C1ATD2_9BACT|nr:hypothetical protein [Limnoglobus roseus]QEL20862.1 hypothetical protein PX52LOC_07982 [Limnoglobus roseus]
MQLPPTPMILDELRTTVGPSFLIGVGVLIFYRLVLGKSYTPLAAVVALVLSLAVGNHLGQLNPAWWPTEKRFTWLLWLAAAGSLAAAVVRSLKWPTVGHALWAAVAAVAVIRVVPKDYLTTPTWAVPAFVLLAAAVGFGLMRLSERRPGPLTPFVMAAALMTAGAVVIHAHSKSLLDVATLGGMCLFGIAAVVLVTKGDAGPALPGAAFLLTGVLLAGHYETFSKVPTTAFVLPAVAPLLALVGLIPAVDRQQPWVRLVIVLLPVLAVLAVAGGLAAANESLAFGEDEY